MLKNPKCDRVEHLLNGLEYDYQLLFQELSRHGEDPIIAGLLEELRRHEDLFTLPVIAH